MKSDTARFYRQRGNGGHTFGYASKMVRVASVFAKRTDSGNAGDGIDFFAYSRRIPRAAMERPDDKSRPKLELHVAAVADGRRQGISTG